ncbi:MAG: hypothetical protein ISS82_05060, partial [Nanoarchaeota archaeon]|nr:hypothetical protein [Nanoarchaeota archaeon]
MEEKEALVIDTSFISSFFKIKQLNLIFRAFNVKKIIIAKAVLRELEESIFYEEFFELLEKGNIIIKEVKGIKSSGDFGDGELESISLAKSMDSVLLMNDKIAEKLAKDRKVVVVNIHEFLLDCKKRNILSLEEIKQII